MELNSTSTEFLMLFLPLDLSIPPKKGMYKLLAHIIINTRDVAVPRDIVFASWMQHPLGAGKAVRKISILPHRRGTIRLAKLLSHCSKQITAASGKKKTCGYYNTMNDTLVYSAEIEAE